jgi:hypothetical protein
MVASSVGRRHRPSWLSNDSPGDTPRLVLPLYPQRGVPSTAPQDGTWEKRKCLLSWKWKDATTEILVGR